MSWRWVSKQALVLLHGESLATHGGREGMRDEGLLDSALMRPQNILAYADADNPPDAAALAASYGVGLAKNHPFVDGNKRAALVPRRFVWNLTARIHRSGARWGLWATRQSELSTNPRGGVLCQGGLQDGCGH